jgi:uncharacterized protein (DUF1015 family)
MGMYIQGQWYHLFARPHVYRGKRLTDRLGAVLLQELVLSSIFSIHDPKTDARLKCAGGEKALEEIGALFHTHPAAIAFTLCPLTADDLTRAADEGFILPPKSTWIVPKIPYGLLIHQHQNDLNAGLIRH